MLIPATPTHTILIIEDTPKTLHLLAALLRKHHYAIQTATNGQAALHLVGLEPPDLILLDVRLTDMDGYTLCRQLRALPQTSDIPIIFISAIYETINILRAFEAGAVDYIPKPFQAEEVLARVHTQLVLLQSRRKIEQINSQLVHTVQYLEYRNHQMNMLYQFSTALQGVETLDDLANLSVPFLCELFPHYQGALYLRHSQSGMFQLIFHWGAPPATFITPVGSPCQVIEHIPVVSVCELAHCSQCQRTHIPDHNGGFCIELASDGVPLGLLSLQSELLADEDTTKSQEQLIRMVGDLFALNLSNIRLRTELHHQAVRDPLTGTFNRRYLDQTLERELHQAQQQDMPIGLLLIDIDHFKQYNDTFGHDIGDAVLCAVSSLLQNHTRRDDIVCRLGGDEFVIVMPGAPRIAAQRRAEYLRGAVTALRVNGLDPMLNPITISIGVVAFPTDATSAPGLLKQADRALYQAKATGRNQVVPIELVQL